MSADNQSPTVRVWDPMVRVGHWLLVAAFATAYITEGEVMPLHAWAGYTIATVVILRVAWGFLGTPHARFRSFARSPVAAYRYLVDMIRGRARRHIGHSPAGAVMVFMLLACLAATCSAGLVVYAIEEQAGPLVFLAGAVSEEVGEVWEEAHEILANLTLFLVILHVAGVIAASITHRENLVRAMVTGRKRAPESPAGAADGSKPEGAGTSAPARPRT